MKRIAQHLDLNTVSLYNLYGPAECTLGSVYHEFKVDDIERGVIPIGLPFPNMQAQVLDQFYQWTVPGMKGELFLDGIQRFPGYFGRDDLTKSAFYGSFYRTGDIVRMDKQGLLSYIGRKDNQIKLRGQRIEPGEIERCVLEASPHISKCVVVKWEDNHLIAYIEGFDVDEDKLRKHCQSRLPIFMIPSAFIVLEKLPLNANGKLDRKG
ncbi:unnamed protein product, partial [Adineta ricciae]